MAAAAAGGHVDEVRMEALIASTIKVRCCHERLPGRARVRE